MVALYHFTEKKFRDLPIFYNKYRTDFINSETVVK